MENTKIDWCDSTWNPVTGCLHDCEYCYARTMVHRFSGVRAENSKRTVAELDEPYIGGDGRRKPYPYGFEIPTFHRYRLGDYENKEGRSIFVCSMADLFGDWIPDEWIQEVFAACEKAPQHTYLFLTKNPYRYIKLRNQNKLPCRDNMWYGATATNKKQLAIATNRNQVVFPAGAFALLGPEYKTFLSIEPLLENVAEDGWEFGQSIKHCDWVIVGAETGSRKGKVIPEKRWIHSIQDLCSGKQVPLFMKDSIRPILGNAFYMVQQFPWKEDNNHE